MAAHLLMVSSIPWDWGGWHFFFCGTGLVKDFRGLGKPLGMCCGWVDIPPWFGMA
jgi:hypothetical protein